MICLQWTMPVVVTHNFAQNAFLIYAGFSASNGGHFPVYSTTFLPFFERKFDAYLRFTLTFGDMPLWNSLASGGVLPYRERCRTDGGIIRRETVQSEQFLPTKPSMPPRLA